MSHLSEEQQILKQVDTVLDFIDLCSKRIDINLKQNFKLNQDTDLALNCGHLKTLVETLRSEVNHYSNIETLRDEK